MPNARKAIQTPRRIMPPCFPPAWISMALPPGKATRRKSWLSAARIAAVQADIAAFLMGQRRCPAVGTLAHPGRRGAGAVGRLAGAGGQLEPRLDRLGDARRIVR